VRARSLAPPTLTRSFVARRGPGRARPALSGARHRGDELGAIVRGKARLAGPSEDDIDPGKNGRESRARNFSNKPLQNLSVERDDLGNVGNGRLCEARIAGRETNVSRGLGPLDLRSERHTDHGCRGASVQSVALNDQNRSART